MVDPERVRHAFEAHLKRPLDLARWELIYPVMMGGVSETWSLTFALSPEIGDVARLFPDAFRNYTKNEKGVHATQGRSIYFRTCAIDRSPYHFRPNGGSEVVVSVSGNALPPWDGGAQDALLKTLATELMPYVDAAESYRWTASPFEDNDPPSMNAEKARALIARLTQEKVLVEFETDYFTRAETANPDLAVNFHVQPVCDSRCTEQAVSDRNSSGWIASGEYRAFAYARVYSQPLCTRWPHVDDFKKSRAFSVLWRSPYIAFELRPTRKYRFFVGLPKDRRSLTDEERKFIENVHAKLEHPREIIDFRLISDEPSAR